MYTRLKDIRRLRGLPETIEVCLQAPAPITCTKFNPFGTLLASGSSNGDVNLWAWSTRGIARTFPGGHTKPVTSLLWSSDGRQLASASLDGSLVIWDVLSGSKIISKNLNQGGILHVGAVVSSSNSNTSNSATTDDNIWLNRLDEARLVASFEKNEAQILDMKNLNMTAAAAATDIPAAPVSVLPVAALEGPSRGARLLTGSSAALTGQRIATSPCGKFIASTARGVVCLISAENLSILDAVKIKGVPKKIKSLQFDSSGKQLLVATTDRFVRIYTILPVAEEPITDGVDVAKQKKGIGRTQGVDLEFLMTAADDFFQPEGSLIHNQNKNKSTNTNAATGIEQAPVYSTVQLKLTRLFDAQVEKLFWGACAFSPDGEHLVTAIDPASNEHVIYTWNIFHGYAENTLQAGSDGIVQLIWHPEPAPMQCLAVGKSGKIYVWAKVMTQDWSAFAPDFETLTDNREHIEEETEFDVEVVDPIEERQQQEKKEKEEEEIVDHKVGVAGRKKKNGVGKLKSGTASGPSNKFTLLSGEEEIVDIESWEWLDTTRTNLKPSKSTSGGGDENTNTAADTAAPVEEMWKSGWSAAGTAGPLLHLPVIWPTEPVDEGVVEGKMKEKEEEGNEEEIVPMAVDEEAEENGKGGDDEIEKFNGLKENGEDEEDEDAEKSKKARLE